MSNLQEQLHSIFESFVNYANDLTCPMCEEYDECECECDRVTKQDFRDFMLNVYEELEETATKDELQFFDKNLDWYVFGEWEARNKNEVYDDDNVYPFQYKGKMYYRNFKNEVWNYLSADEVGEWEGKYDPITHTIDTTAEEPMEE